MKIGSPVIRHTAFGAVATELGIALAARGHEIHFITYRQPFRLPSFLPNVFFHEVDVGRYPLFEFPPYDLALAVRMHEVVQSHDLDLLHCHYAIPHATSAWIAREMLRQQKKDVKVSLHFTAPTNHRRTGPLVSPDHEVLDRKVRQAQAVSEYCGVRILGLWLYRVRCAGDPQLHRPRATTATITKRAW